MKVSRTVVPAGEFKTHCLRLLDRVQKTGDTIIVTKRGRPVAKVVRVDDARRVSLRGTVHVHGDIVGPILGGWEPDA